MPDNYTITVDGQDYEVAWDKPNPPGKADWDGIASGIRGQNKPAATPAPSPASNPALAAMGGAAIGGVSKGPLPGLGGPGYTPPARQQSANPLQAAAPAAFSAPSGAYNPFGSPSAAPTIPGTVLPAATAPTRPIAPNIPNPKATGFAPGSPIAPSSMIPLGGNDREKVDLGAGYKQLSDAFGNKAANLLLGMGISSQAAFNEHINNLPAWQKRDFLGKLGISSEKINNAAPGVINFLANTATGRPQGGLTSPKATPADIAADLQTQRNQAAALKGVTKTATGLANDPLMVAAGIATGGLGELGEVPAIFQKAIEAGFSLDQLGSNAPEFVDAIQKGDYERAGQAGAGTVMGSLIAAHLLKGGHPTVTTPFVDEIGQEVPSRVTLDGDNFTIQLPKRGDTPGVKQTMPAADVPAFLEQQGLKHPSPAPVVNADLTDFRPGQTVHSVDGQKLTVVGVGVGKNAENISVRNEGGEVFRIPKVPPAPEPVAAPTEAPIAEAAPVAPVQAGESANTPAPTVTPPVAETPATPEPSFEQQVAEARARVQAIRAKEIADQQQPEPSAPPVQTEAIAEPPRAPASALTPAEVPAAVKSQARMVDPRNMEFREGMQNNTADVADMFPGDEYFPIVTIHEPGGGESILDGHNRASLAIDRGHQIPAVGIDRSEYDTLKKAGFDDMEISYAALSDAKEYDAAQGIDQKFAGDNVAKRGAKAESLLEKIRQSEPAAPPPADVKSAETGAGMAKAVPSTSAEFGRVVPDNSTLAAMSDRPFQVSLFDGDMLRETHVGKRTPGQVAAQNGMNPALSFKTEAQAQAANDKAFKLFQKQSEASNTLSDKLDTAATAARQRIADRAAKGKGSGTVNSGPNIFKGLENYDLQDLVIIGAKHIKDGAVNLADWSKAMVEEFGDAIKPHLAALHDAAFDMYREEVGKIFPTSDAASPQEPSVNARETPPPVIPETPQAATEVPPQVTAGKNAASDAERAQHNLPPVEKQAYTGIEEGLAQGKEQYQKDPIGTARLVDDIKTKPRTLTPAENGAVVEYKQNLLAHAENVRKALDEAIDSKNAPEVDRLRQQYAEAQSGIKDATEALAKAGREWSAAGQARKGVTQIDYANATEAVLEARRFKGADLKAADAKAITATADALKAVQDKIDAAMPKPVRQQQNKAAQDAKPLPSDFGSKNTVFTADRGQAAIQRLRDAVESAKSGNKLSAGVDPTRGLLDKVDLSDLIEAGGYLLEGGLRKFGDWVTQMRSVVGPDFDDATAQHVWARVKAEAQQSPNAPKIPEPSNLVETLGKRMGWQKASDFLNAIQGDDGSTAILDKLIHAEELTPAEKATVKAAYEANRPARAAGDTNAAPDPLQAIREAVNEGRQASSPGRVQDIQAKIDDIKQQLESGNLKPVEKRQAGTLSPQEQELKDLRLQLEKERRFQNPPEVTDKEIADNAADPQRAAEARSGQKRIDDLKLQAAALEKAMSSPEELKKYQAAQDAAKADRQAKADAVPAEVQKLMQQRDYLAKQVQAQIEAQKPKTLLQKVVDTSRQFKLSSLSVFAKLGGMSLWAPPVEALADMLSTPYAKLSAGDGKNLGEVASREGTFSPKAEVTGLRKMASREAMQNAKDTIVNGFNSIDAQSGKDLHVDNANEGPMKYIGRTHGAIKSFLQTGQFNKSLEIRMQKARAAGVDLSDPETVAKIGMGAAVDAQNVKLQGDNALATGFNKAIGSFEKSPSQGIQAFGSFLRTLAPIVKIPANYIGRAADMTGLGVARGAVSHIKALSDVAKTGEPMPPEVADNILKAYKYGSLGLVAAYLGIAQPSWFKSSGFYSKGANYGTNEKGEPAQASELQIANHTVPHLLSHNPFLEAVQFWATVRRGMEQSKGETSTGRTASGGYQALRGLLEEAPGLESTVQIGKAMEDEGNAGKAIGAYTKGLVIPQIVQQGAKQMDKDATGKVIPREQKDFTQTVQEGVPGLRNQLPVKGSAGRQGAPKSPEAIIKQINSIGKVKVPTGIKPRR